MREIRIATPEEIEQLSKLSVRIGNIPLFKGKAHAAIMWDEKEIVGFAAVQQAWHASGSWVKDDLRRHGFSYQMRNVLDNHLRRALGAPVYFSIPGSDFEKTLFAKYGHVIEQMAQVRSL